MPAKTSDKGLIAPIRTAMRHELNGVVQRRSDDELGRMGEREVVAKIKCPRCSRPLELLAPNTPLFDVKCTDRNCSFLAQVKTSGEPSSRISQAGWDVMERWLQDPTHRVPPLIVNLKWDGRQEIRMYPYIKRENLKPYQLSPRHRRMPNYWMFNYIKLDELKFILLYSEELPVPQD